MEQGLIHAYIGQGRGKTSTAVGTVLRALNAGMKVLFVQIMKSRKSGEIEILKTLDNITIKRYLEMKKFSWELDNNEKDKFRNEVSELLEYIKNAYSNKDYDMIVLDEVLNAYTTGFIEENEIISLLNNKPDSIELIITGRDISNNMMCLCDYLMKIECINHPYQKGIGARKGVDY